jgi:uncharacterized protein YkwD
MERRYLLVYTRLGYSNVLVVGFLGVVNLACLLGDQAQNVPQQNVANPQQSEPSATPNSPKKKPTKSGVKRHSNLRDNASEGAQSPLGIWHPLDPNPDTAKVSPDARIPQQSFDANRMADLEKQMWLLVNQDRSNPETFAQTGGRAQPLKWNESLAAVARAHSRNMVEQRFFSHVGSDGRTYQMRIDEAGIPWLAAGENIAKWDTVRGAEATFMDNLNHRYNILNALYTDVGIGIVQGPDGNLYITQDFVATPLGCSTVKRGP